MQAPANPASGSGPAATRAGSGRGAHGRTSAGFTLIEVMVAMGVFVLLMAGLAGITTACLRLGQGVLEAEQEDAVRDGFERLIRENLAEIPQDSPMMVQAGSGGGTQTVVLGKAAGLFPVSGLPLVTESVALETRRNRGGQLSLWLLYYAGDLPKALQDNAVENDLMVTIPFKDGLDLLHWRVYDPTVDKWLDTWEETGRRPHYLEMVYRFSGDVADHRMVFWIPALQANAAQGDQGTGGGAGGAGGQNPGVPGDGATPIPGGGAGVGGPGGSGIKVEVPR